MLRYLEEEQAADRIEGAVQRVFAAGKCLTGDLGGRATTGQFVEAVLPEMK
jgi:isocitrate dehydrogenase (NAD+)